MGSRRMIDPAFWQSETIAAYPLAVRYFFIGLFSNADDQGRLRAHPALLRSLIYPYDDISLEEVSSMVERLCGADGPIQVYESEGRELIQILNWWRWQRPSWAWPSDLEPPPGWVDRHCYRRGNAVIKENWDQDEPTVGPERDQSEVSASNAPSTSTSIRDSTSTRIAVAPALDETGTVVLDGAAAIVVLKAYGMNQPERVMRETKLTPAEVIETVQYAEQEGIRAGLLRTMLRQNEAHRPRAPADKRWWVGTEYEGIVES